MVLLPAEVNLGSPAHADRYKTARVKVTGKKPGRFITRTGAPIVYSVTIPTNAANPKTAAAFLVLLFSPEGRKIMNDNGQAPIKPPKIDGVERLPAGLKAMLTTQ